MKSLQRGADLLCQEKDVHLQQNLRDKWSSYMKTGNQELPPVKEYELSPSALDRWIKQAQTSGSFSEKDNRSAEENELIALRKRVQRLEMENDILKQAALIMGRK
ncbi:hypothetical protein GCM10010917_19790 [Paenibacillus physcomitrellae]|uniref:Transposase n=1 Tax=Paenibacillus physcomitrellae TaxID=1619311 RepID=A0ABQ1G1F5_9BACL|nr:hypothetical protein GCM10010917_19790 [Paenibacillus physcomitrellae]